MHVISIHTPAKGVTALELVTGYWGIISIHTPAKGVTESSYGVGDLIENFNPHSREGSDGRQCILGDGEYISIHTPAKGVT